MGASGGATLNWGNVLAEKWLGFECYNLNKPQVIFRTSESSYSLNVALHQWTQSTDADLFLYSGSKWFVIVSKVLAQNPQNADFAFKPFTTTVNINENSQTASETCAQDVMGITLGVLTGEIPVPDILTYEAKDNFEQIFQIWKPNSMTLDSFNNPVLLAKLGTATKELNNMCQLPERVFYEKSF